MNSQAAIHTSSTNGCNGTKINLGRTVWSQVSGLNQKDFEKLALPLLDPLYNFARWMCSDADEARDLVQETFAKALKALSSFREGTNFRAWMFRILRNTFLTSRTGLERRNTVQESEEGLDDSVVTHDTPELALVRRADTELVQQAIAKLPVGFQDGSSACTATSRMRHKRRHHCAASK